MITTPWRALRERHDRLRWEARRQEERIVEQLAAEAALFLEDPQPPVTPWPTEFELGG